MLVVQSKYRNLKINQPYRVLQSGRDYYLISVNGRAQYVPYWVEKTDFGLKINAEDKDE